MSTEHHFCSASSLDAALVRNFVIGRRLCSRAGRFFSWPGLPSDQACDVSAQDAEHYCQSPMLVAKIAWFAAIELRQSFDSIGEDVAVLKSRVPHDDG